ncbi:MAG: DUF5018 domain-containing protein [Reichenbachiella sp.]|uniref:DUF5018 domain-containing protein n=1 Tax=Reichenbachiella sp. TaxID=2184521 RepID=UPI002966EF14|nr:DUF5018 domain-containing protein [Reichenbachiella sp.]MDW3209058.1 DUF5018 domain-containing protein [Reichenbachiella sp.]
MKSAEFKNLFWYALLTILSVFVSKNVKGQQPELVADINQTLINTNPRNLVNVDGTLYFSGFTNNRGYQMFTYDGTTSTGIFFRDGYGDQNWAANEFIKVGENIYFRSGDEGGLELRKYDGETVTDIDIYPGFDSSGPQWLTEYNGNLYFSAVDENDGRELWKYDGENLTSFDINDGAGSSDPEGLMVYNNELVFVANDATNGREIWTYDGENLASFNINGSGDGIVNSFEDELTEYNGVLYFVGNDGSGRELWAYDGTEVYNVNDDLVLEDELYEPRYLTLFDGKLFFEGYIGESVTDELCYFDGASVGLADASVPASTISTIAATTTHLFFRGQNGNGKELFVFDGTDIVEFDLNEGEGESFPWYLTPVNDRLYFTATTPDHGEELWMHDGTNATVIDIYEGASGSTPRYLTANGGDIYLKAQGQIDGSSVSTLWKHDGTDLNYVDFSGQTSDAYPYYLTEFQDKLYFSAENEEFGGELYAYDGVSLEMVDDIYEGGDGSYPEALTVFGDELLFFAENEIGNYFYVYDGTSFMTYEVDGNNVPMIEYNGAVYFSGSDGSNGIELWKYDGSSIAMVQDINESGNSSPEEFFIHDGMLFFKAWDGINGVELWMYNGTTATMVDNLATDVNGGHGSPSDFTSYDGDLYFTSYSDDYGRELFVYNGESVSPIDIYTGTESSHATNLTVFDGKLVFRANNGSNGTEMYTYTVGDSDPVLIDINSGAENSNARYFTEHRGDLYFGATDGINGYELWKYDGTNVSIVENKIEGEDGLGISSIHSFGGMMYLTCYVNSNYELYRSNGTEVEFVDDIYLYDDEEYGPPLVFGDHFYFNGASIAYGGEELWRIRKTSEETDLLTFSIADQSGESTINTTNHTVTVEMPFGTNLSSLSPILTVSDYAEVTPSSGVSQDFSDGAVSYTITAEYGNMQDWQVTVVAGEASTETDILSFEMEEQKSEANIDADSHTVSIELLLDTDVSNLNPSITLSEGATISPTGAQDFSSPVTYTVTAQDGSTAQTWEVSVTAEQSQVTAVNTLKYKVSVHPNPASEWLFIEGNFSQEANIRLVDLGGKEWRKRPISNNQILNLIGLHPGMYFLTIQDKNITTTAKVLIQ